MREWDLEPEIEFEPVCAYDLLAPTSCLVEATHTTTGGCVGGGEGVGCARRGGSGCAGGGVGGEKGVGGGWVRGVEGWGFEHLFCR